MLSLHWKWCEDLWTHRFFLAQNPEKSQEKEKRKETNEKKRSKRKDKKEKIKRKRKHTHFIFKPYQLSFPVIKTINHNYIT